MAPTKPKGLQDQHKMKSDKHVLDNPDTYIGGVEPTEMILLSLTKMKREM